MGIPERSEVGVPGVYVCPALSIHMQDRHPGPCMRDSSSALSSKYTCLPSCLLCVCYPAFLVLSVCLPPVVCLLAFPAASYTIIFLLLIIIIIIINGSVGGRGGGSRSNTSLTLQVLLSKAKFLCCVKVTEIFRLFPSLLIYTRLTVSTYFIFRNKKELTILYPT